MKKNNILITLPDLRGKGGVSSFYKVVLPYLNNNLNIIILEIGSVHSKEKFFYKINDQINFYKKLIYERPNLVLINPSFYFKSFIRDGIFTWQAKRKKVNVIVFFHGWNWKFVRKVSNFLVLKWFFKKTFAKADAFIVLASEFKKQLVRWQIKVPIYLLTTAVEDSLLEGFDIKQKIEFLRNDKLVKLLFLARIEKEKGIFETVEAFKILILKKLPVQLSIAGDGSVLNTIKQYVNSSHIKDKVNFLGYIKGKEKAKVFAEHDIYCFPTYGEGMPVSLLEAMAFGLPVVTRAVGGIKDFFQNEKMGFITDSKEPQVISSFIEELVHDRTKLIKICEYNYNYAKKNFLASIVAKKMIKICKMYS